MSTIVLKDGGTTATTGGTDQTFSQTPVPVNNGYEYADVSETDHLLRQKVLISTRAHQLQSDGTYSKDKRSLRFVLPVTLADGTISFAVSRVEVEFHPEASVAQLAELREMASQMCISSAFDAVYTAGILP